jgi:hypothetical protein
MRFKNGEDWALTSPLAPLPAQGRGIFDLRGEGNRELPFPCRSLDPATLSGGRGLGVRSACVLGPNRNATCDDTSDKIHQEGKDTWLTLS